MKLQNIFPFLLLWVIYFASFCFAESIVYISPNANVTFVDNYITQGTTVNTCGYSSEVPCFLSQRLVDEIPEATTLKLSSGIYNISSEIIIRKSISFIGDEENLSPILDCGMNGRSFLVNGSKPEFGTICAANETVESLNFTLKHMTIQNCVANDWIGGGAVAVYGAYWVLIEHVNFTSNAVLRAPQSPYTPEMLRNIAECKSRYPKMPVIQNHPDTQAGGGAIVLVQVSVGVFRSSKFSSNTATRYGAAISAAVTNQLRIDNCIFESNGITGETLEWQSRYQYPSIIFGGAVSYSSNGLPSQMTPKLDNSSTNPYIQKLAINTWYQLQIDNPDELKTALGIHDSEFVDDLNRIIMDVLIITDTKFLKNGVFMRYSFWNDEIHYNGYTGGGAVKYNTIHNSNLGVAVEFTDKPTAIFRNCDFVSNYAEQIGVPCGNIQGGALDLSNMNFYCPKSKFEIVGCRFEGNQALSHYGYLSKNSLPFRNHGGAVYMFSSSGFVLNITGNKFLRNTARVGEPVVHMAYQGKLVQIKGGAISIYLEEGHINALDEMLIVNQNEFVDNIAQSYSVDIAQVSGGAIHVDGELKAYNPNLSTKLKITNSYFKGDSAAMSDAIDGVVTGGHVSVRMTAKRTVPFQKTFDLDVRNTSFVKGRAESESIRLSNIESRGGAFALIFHGDSISNTNVNFQNVTAIESSTVCRIVHKEQKAYIKLEGLGQGLITAGGGAFSFMVTGTDVSNTRISLDNVQIEDTKAIARGSRSEISVTLALGGALHYNFTTISGRALENTFQFTNGVVRNSLVHSKYSQRLSDANGGGLAISCENRVPETEFVPKYFNKRDCAVKVDNLTVEQNAVITEWSSSSSAYGAGLSFISSASRYDFTVKNSRFVGNRIQASSDIAAASSLGSAVFLSYSELANSDYMYNRITHLMENSNSTAIFSNTLFSSNYFVNPLFEQTGSGTVFLKFLLSFNITCIFDEGCEFSNNRAPREAGVAVYLEAYISPTLFFHKARFIDNVATSQHTGGLSLFFSQIHDQQQLGMEELGKLFTGEQRHNPVGLYECSFERNSAESYGGAIRLHDVDVDIKDTKFESNSVSGMGGAISAIRSTMHTSNVQFTNNEAAKAQVASLELSKWYAGPGTFIGMSKDLIGVWLHHSELIRTEQNYTRIAIQKTTKNPHIGSIFQCPVGSPLNVKSMTVNSSQLACLTCPDGFYSIGEQDKECHDCKSLGLVCHGGSEVKTLFGNMAIAEEAKLVPMLAPPNYGCSSSECEWSSSCSGGHSGLVPYCSGCPAGKTMAFGTSDCIPDSQCGGTIAWLLICTSVILCAAFVFVQIRLAKSRVSRSAVNAPDTDLTQSSVIKSAIYFLQTVDLFTPMNSAGSAERVLGSFFTLSVDGVGRAASGGFCLAPMTGSEKILFDYFIPLVILGVWLLAYAYQKVLIQMKRRYALQASKPIKNNFSLETIVNEKDRMLDLSAGLKRDEEEKEAEKRKRVSWATDEAQGKLSDQLKRHTSYFSHRQDAKAKTVFGVRTVQYIVALWSIGLFTYAQITKTTLKLLDCRPGLGGTSVMFWDGNVECFSTASGPQIVAQCVLPLILLFPILIAYRTYTSAKAHREIREKEKETINESPHEITRNLALKTVLWNYYKPECWYWESVMIFRRLLLIGCDYLVKDNTYPVRGAVLFVLSLFVALFHEGMQPFRMRLANRMESLHLWILVTISGFSMLQSAYSLLGKSVLEFQAVVWVGEIKIGVTELLITIVIGLVMAEVVISILVAIVRSNQTGAIWTSLNRVVDWLGRTKKNENDNTEARKAVRVRGWTSWNESKQLEPLLEEGN